MPKLRSQKSATSGSLQKMPIPSTPQKLPGPPAEPNSFNVIAYERVEALDEEFEAVAKETLRRAMESAEYGAAEEVTTYGNRAGLDLLEERDDMRERMKRLEDRMARFADKHEGQIADLQGKIADYKDEIADYKLPQKLRLRNRLCGYRNIRTVR